MVIVLNLRTPGVGVGDGECDDDAGSSIRKVSACCSRNELSFDVLHAVSRLVKCLHLSTRLDATSYHQPF